MADISQKKYLDSNGITHLVEQLDDRYVNSDEISTIISDELATKKNVPTMITQSDYDDLVNRGELESGRIYYIIPNEGV